MAVGSLSRLELGLFFGRSSNIYFFLYNSAVILCFCLSLNISILYYAFKDLSRKILNYFSNPSPKGEAHYCASRWSTKCCKSVLVALTMLGTVIPSAVSIRATSSPFRTTGSPAFVTLGCAL